jgi:hypothetical protein
MLLFVLSMTIAFHTQTLQLQASKGESYENTNKYHFQSHHRVPLICLCIDLSCSISNLSRRLNILFALISRRTTGHDLPNNSDSPLRATSLSRKDLSSLINNEYTARGTLGCLLETNGGDECLRRIAKQWVREVMFGLEGGVRFW